jgi:UDP-N-acetylmuramoyl-L-alanyl-D-glutamate--2,6-diaminopimelate ligase
LKNTNCPYQIISDRREAIFQAISKAKPNDVVIIAGKGHETYQIVGNEKYHFDDREVALDALLKLDE